MSIYRRGFDKTKCTYFLKKDKFFLINIMKFGKNFAILSKEKLIVNLHTLKKI